MIVEEWGKVSLDEFFQLLHGSGERFPLWERPLMNQGQNQPISQYQIVSLPSIILLPDAEHLFPDFVYYSNNFWKNGHIHDNSCI